MARGKALHFHIDFLISSEPEGQSHPMFWLQNTIQVTVICMAICYCFFVFCFFCNGLSIRPMQIGRSTAVFSLCPERLQLGGGTAGRSRGGECQAGQCPVTPACSSPAAGITWYKPVDRGASACLEGLRCSSIEYKLLRLTADQK